MIVVADFTEADGIGRSLLAAHQLPGLARVLVRAHPMNREILAEESGLELEILPGRTQRDADYLLHRISPLSHFLNYPGQ